MLRCKNNIIRSIEIHGRNSRENPIIANDKEAALRDLKHESYFDPDENTKGPYDVILSIEENRLIFRITNSSQDKIPIRILSLKPYRRLIKDYFIMIESYNKAILEGQHARIEAIDMGRRGLHNEGASLLMERLSDKININMETARRLFTLICVLHSEVHSLRE